MSKPNPVDAVTHVSYISWFFFENLEPTKVLNRHFADSLRFYYQLDPYSAAQNSQFNVSRSGNKYGSRPRWGSGGSGSGYGGGGPGGPGGGGGFGPKRIGRIDDIRAPECGSCG